MNPVFSETSQQTAPVSFPQTLLTLDAFFHSAGIYGCQGRIIETMRGFPEGTHGSARRITLMWCPQWYHWIGCSINNLKPFPVGGCTSLPDLPGHESFWPSHTLPQFTERNMDVRDPEKDLSGEKKKKGFYPNSIFKLYTLSKAKSQSLFCFT